MTAYRRVFVLARGASEWSLQACHFQPLAVGQRPVRTMTDRPKWNPGDPLGYFLTWSSYGTWLPGDERGWSRKYDWDIQPPNPSVVKFAQSRMKEPAFTLSINSRILVEDTIRRHCSIRGWTLHAVNARSNHVHVVVTAPSYPPEKAREQFKAWSTRRLKEIEPTRTRFWTEGGSCRWINHEADLEAAVIYVLEGQDRKESKDG